VQAHGRVYQAGPPWRRCPSTPRGSDSLLTASVDSGYVQKFARSATPLLSGLLARFDSFVDQIWASLLFAYLIEPVFVKERSSVQSDGLLTEACGVTVAETVFNALLKRGYSHFTGVPCSLLKGLFRLLENPNSPVTYIPAPREDSALGVASGLAVAGARPVVLMQNSGLGYSLNVLTSFNLIYDVHLPVVVSWRGHGGNDAVEHDVIGRELTRLLDVFGLPWTVLDNERPEDSVGAFLKQYDSGRSSAVLIVREGI
jgi:sulfopyruvate decarboxylase subunit alpha